MARVARASDIQKAVPKSSKSFECGILPHEINIAGMYSGNDKMEDIQNTYAISFHMKSKQTYTALA